MKNLRLFFFAVFLGCFIPVLSHAQQGVYIPPRTVTGTVNGITRPISGATVTVCGPNIGGTPCSPALANTVFKDSALTVPLSNPFTTDANGNYPQAALAGGVYTITESAPGFTGFSYQVTVSCAPGGCNITSLTATSGTFTGPVTSCIINGMYVAGSSCYATVQAAINAAIAGGCGTGSVYVLPSYNVVNETNWNNNTCNVPIIWAGNQEPNSGTFRVYSRISTIPNPTVPGGGGFYPWGQDLPLEVAGSASVRFNNLATLSAGTAASTINVGSNPNVLVTPSTGVTTTTYGTANSVYTIGRETPNEENLVGVSTCAGLVSGQASIVDSTHLCIFATKAHTIGGPDNNNKNLIDIEQIGAIAFGSYAMSIQSNFAKPSQLTGRQPPFRILDSNLSRVIDIPGTVADTFPFNAVAFGVPLTGQAGQFGARVAADLNLKNAAAPNCTQMQLSTGQNGASFCDGLTTLALPVNYVNGNLTQFCSDNPCTVIKASVNALSGRVGVTNLVSIGTAATLTGTGACATITTQTGGALAGRATCTGATAASTLIITPGLTAPNGWVCAVQDQTTRANLLQQTSTTTTACTLTATSVTQNDVFVFTAIAF